MSIANNIANRGYEEESRFTSSDFLGRPVPRKLHRIKRIRNRIAKRAEARQDLDERLTDGS